jgi:spore coat-associated protein N
MTASATSRSTARRARPLLALAVVALAITSIGAGVFSLALFTSTATVGANTFTTGTIVIGTSPASALLTAANMMPGDSVTAPITVSNTGTSQLRYAVTAATTDPDTKGLRTQLTIAIKSGVTTCTNAGFGASGTSVTSAVALGTTTLNVIGDPTSGSQTGDRTLNSSSNEILCFQVSLPLATGNAYQGATATTTFSFVAEQTANN